MFKTITKQRRNRFAPSGTHTARIDRREKLLAYQGLPSLQTYLLVDQDARRVEVYRRANGWTVEYVEQGSIRIDCLDTELPLAEVYADVPG
ncbi:MAG: Uma2 family endonuclease [Porticoccaceae bacterium]